MPACDEVPSRSRGNCTVAAVYGIGMNGACSSRGTDGIAGPSFFGALFFFACIGDQ
jgi:hypothetical protein